MKRFISAVIVLIMMLTMSTSVAMAKTYNAPKKYGLE